MLLLIMAFVFLLPVTWSEHRDDANAPWLHGDTGPAAASFLERQMSEAPTAGFQIRAH